MKKLRLQVSNRVSLGSFDLMCILLIVSICYLTQNRTIGTVGIAAIGCIIALCATQLFVLWSGLQISNTAKAFLILDVYLLVRIIFEMRTSALYTGIQALMLLAFFVIMVQMSTEEPVFEKIVRWFTILFYIMVVVYLAAEFSGGVNHLWNYISITTLKICYVLFAFTLIKNSRHLLLRCAAFAVINFILGERTAAVIIPVVYVMLWYLKRARLTRGKFYALFWLVALPCVLFPYAYVQLSHASFRSALDALSLEYTGGRFFSGRNVLWELIFPASPPIRCLVWGLETPFFRTTISPSPPTTSICFFWRSAAWQRWSSSCCACFPCGRHTTLPFTWSAPKLWRPICWA